MAGLAAAHSTKLTIHKGGGNTHNQSVAHAPLLMAPRGPSKPISELRLHRRCTIICVSLRFGADSAPLTCLLCFPRVNATVYALHSCVRPFTFTQDICRAMASHANRPIVLPLSPDNAECSAQQVRPRLHLRLCLEPPPDAPNAPLSASATAAGLYGTPSLTSVRPLPSHPIPQTPHTLCAHARARCWPPQAYEWTDGRALVATEQGGSEVHAGSAGARPSQASSIYIFPGMGLGTASRLLLRVLHAVLAFLALA